MGGVLSYIGFGGDDDSDGGVSATGTVPDVPKNDIDEINSAADYEENLRGPNGLQQFIGVPQESVNRTGSATAIGGIVFSKARQHREAQQKVDCSLSEWTDWSTCSEACRGKQKRRREVLVVPTGGGKTCAKLHEMRPCNLPGPEGCPGEKGTDLNCMVGAWSEFSSCEFGTDGTCQKHRERPVITFPQGKGKVCPSLKETLPCNTCMKEGGSGNLQESFYNLDTFGLIDRMALIR